MSEPSAPALQESEWTVGWRIVLGCALASATGIVLLFFTFNLFVLPTIAELKISRGEFGTVQALIVTAALGAPVMGLAADRFGFKPVYLVCAAIIVIAEILIAAFANSLFHVAIGIAVLGFFGIGSTAVVTTRPVNAHFVQYRGRALGLVAVGVSVTTFLVPPVLQMIIDDYGWRGGYFLLAGMLLVIGMPATAFLVPASASRAAVQTRDNGPTDWAFLKDRDFVLMAGSITVMGIGAAGFVGQLSPMIQQEGLSAATGALALSVFAFGQFVGRLGGGWLLDHFDPRMIAVVLTVIPGSGFLLLLLSDQMAFAALLAAGMIGLQQGAELDIFAYFTARRFPVVQYGTIYGALHGVSWIGNAIAILGVGWIHDFTGSYDLAQIIGMTALLTGAVLIWLVRLPPLEPRRA
jgi:MFS family permease